MGRKGKSQTKAISKSLGSSEDQADLHRYFNQMIGSEKADPTIVLPKYKLLMALLENIHTLLTCCKTDVLDTLDTYENASEQVAVFTNQLKNLINSKVTDEAFESSKYTLVKDNDIIQTIIVVCSNLSDIHVHLNKTWENVDKKFFLRHDALTFAPLPFAPAFDLKKMWLVDGADNADICEFAFTFMSKLFKSAHVIYKTVTSPDVDVAQLSKIIVKALGGLKQHLPRCEKAFKKIEESVSMLEGNFDSYYKDFIQSKDPTNIFTGFISDVADGCDSDPKLIFQCRKIVNFYKN